MTKYVLDVDFTMSKRIEIEAENAEQAKAEFEKAMKENPYNYACGFHAYVCHEIIDVEEQ